MRLLALTGGIAAGKSLVSSRLRELGAVVVDADVLAREAVAPGSPGLARVAEAFGAGVLQADGSLDRAALGAIVFADPERLAVLNAITHPEVQRLAREAFAAAAAADPDAVVIYDVPLLAENAERLAPQFDGVIVVTADEDERVRRMVEARGMTEQEARARIANQATDAQRLALATQVIDNSGPVEATLAQVDALWEELRARS
ncbi:MAG: dephospho-CoA kinase [Microbacteriaceae bacterium]|nr:dephospho-CoA kinase [Microbacteriaceae bacterium]